MSTLQSPPIKALTMLRNNISPLSAHMLSGTCSGARASYAGGATPSAFGRLSADAFASAGGRRPTVNVLTACSSRSAHRAILNSSAILPTTRLTAPTPRGAAVPDAESMPAAVGGEGLQSKYQDGDLTRRGLRPDAVQVVDRRVKLAV